MTWCIVAADGRCGWRGRLMKEFWLYLVPLFVAVDAVGVLPMFTGLTDGLEPPRRSP